MDRVDIRSRFKRDDYISTKHSMLNVARLLSMHLLLIAWIYFGGTYLPTASFVILSLLVSLIHQRELSEWIHEASHFNFVKSKKLNDVLIHVMAGYFFANDILAHRAGHLVHHRVKEFFCDGDPDSRMLNVTSKKEFVREVLRDLSGVTAFRMFFQRTNESMQKTKKTNFFLIKVAGFQLVIIAICFLTGTLISYVLYYFTLVTLYPLMNRLRVYGQHLELKRDGSVTTSLSSSSRTIDAGLFDSIFFTSDLMKFHHEHHMLPDLPYRAIEKIYEKYSDPNKYMTSRLDIYVRFYKSLR